MAAGDPAPSAIHRVGSLSSDSDATLATSPTTATSAGTIPNSHLTALCSPAASGSGPFMSFIYAASPSFTGANDPKVCLEAPSAE